MSRTMCCDHACTHTCEPPEPTNVGLFWQCPTCRVLWTVTEQTAGNAWAQADMVWRDSEGNLLAQLRAALTPEGTE